MTRLGDDVVGRFDHGLNASVGTTAAPLVTESRGATRGVQLKAGASNAGTVYVGNSDVTASGAAATDGFPLAAGEGLFLAVDDASRVYVVADTANQQVYWLVV